VGADELAGLVAATSSRAVIDLQLMAGFDLHPTKRELVPLAECPDVPAHRTILA
jgi:hypothetical protein